VPGKPLSACYCPAKLRNKLLIPETQRLENPRVGGSIPSLGTIY